MHRTLCPYTIFITAMGAWKLGGLSLACPSFITADTAGVVPISYRDASMERFMRWQQVRRQLACRSVKGHHLPQNGGSYRGCVPASLWISTFAHAKFEPAMLGWVCLGSLSTCSMPSTPARPLPEPFN